jgi:hypothetical protein
LVVERRVRHRNTGHHSSGLGHLCFSISRDSTNRLHGLPIRGLARDRFGVRFINSWLTILGDRVRSFLIVTFT